GEARGAQLVEDEAHGASREGAEDHGTSPVAGVGHGGPGLRGEDVPDGERRAAARGLDLYAEDAVVAAGAEGHEVPARPVVELEQASAGDGHVLPDADPAGRAFPAIPP